jgi:hypothetical protein
MKVTTEQLIVDLYHIWIRGRLGHSTSDRIEWLQIIDRLDNLRDWYGRTTRTLNVPVKGCGVVLRLERTSRELVATFESVETPLDLGSFEEWREESEPADCGTCGRVTLTLNVDGDCQYCARPLSVWAASCNEVA